MAEPERRRRRPAVSCTLCRRRKIRCNRESPCSNCVRSRQDECIYEGQPPLPAANQEQIDGHADPNFQIGLFGRDRCFAVGLDRDSSGSTRSLIHGDPVASLAATSSSASTPPSQEGSWVVESMKSRIRQLEDQLSRATQRPLPPVLPPPPPPIPASSHADSFGSSIAGTFHIHDNSRLFGPIDSIPRGVMHKTRLFGQSHWVNGVTLFRDIFEMLEPHIREETSKTSDGVKKCKSLARLIKSRRNPSWPLIPTTDLPPKVVADELVDCYLRSIETVYRILHVPTFKRDYEALWVSNTVRDMAFLIQVKLILAIGATIYDENFSLRSSAVQWVYEAQCWLSEPESKSRLNIQGLQTNILFLLAKETVNIEKDIWIPIGTLLRTAVYMGLHRDPGRLPKKTVFAAEMRRRLWNTILELAIQSSMNSGGAPFISTEDFDTQPPGNFDDDQLITEDAVPKPEDAFTDSSIAIALRKTFNIRLTIIRLLNNLSSHNSYNETLRLHKELKASYKTLCQTLQRYSSRTVSGSRIGNGSTPSHFAMSLVDVLMRRYLSALHIPFYAAALSDPTFAFSRQLVVENALQSWYTVYPPASASAPICMDPSSVNSNRNDVSGDISASAPSAAASRAQTDLTRFVINGSGFMRTIAIQASFTLAAELRSQLQEGGEAGEGLIPMSYLSAVRRDLLAAAEDARVWNMKCIESGETNIKGYLFTCVIVAQIHGLMEMMRRRGTGAGGNGDAATEREEMAQLLLAGAEKSVEDCLPVLQRQVLVGEEMGGGGMGTLNGMSSSTSPEGEPWDLMMTDATQFNFGSNLDPMNWIFNDGEPEQFAFW